MWSDKSKQAMRDAAILAGIINEDDHHDRLMLISEPEAAAIYCEKTCEQFDMADGDEFMICDAGGKLKYDYMYVMSAHMFMHNITFSY